jgi:hypothetical protein
MPATALQATQRREEFMVYSLGSFIFCLGRPVDPQAGRRSGWKPLLIAAMSVVTHPYGHAHGTCPRHRMLHSRNIINSDQGSRLAPVREPSAVNGQGLRCPDGPRATSTSHATSSRINAQ